LSSSQPSSAGFLGLLAADLLLAEGGISLFTRLTHAEARRAAILVTCLGVAVATGVVVLGTAGVLRGALFFVVFWTLAMPISVVHNLRLMRRFADRRPQGARSPVID
jgi:hypothetical protein